MTNKKSLGSDGFSAEFYNFFWDYLKNYITKAITCNQNIYVTIDSDSEVRIYTCLPKGDKPRQYLKKMATITILNVF